MSILPAFIKFIWDKAFPDVDADFVYTSTLEVVSSFNDEAKSTIKYADEYPVIKENEANRVVSSYEERDEKKTFSGMLFQCKSDESLYYSGDEAEITCVVKNAGREKVSANLCVRDECRYVNAEPGNPVREIFRLTVEGSGRMLAVVENDEYIKYTDIDVTVIQVPEVYITDVEPSEVSYNDEVTLKFTINSETEIKNVRLDFGFDQMNFKTFSGEKMINIQTTGKSLVKGLQMHVSFIDEKGKGYESDEVVKIDVINIPWYAKAVLWLINLF